MKRLCSCIVALSLATLAISLGQSIPVTNPGFEEPPLSDGDFTQGSVPGYTLSGSSIMGVFNPQDSFFPGTSGAGGMVPPPGGGQQLLYIFTTGGNTPGAVTQTTGATILANTTYTLSVAVGQAVASLGRPFAGYEITLLAGATVLATEANLITPAPGTLALVDVSYTTGAADAAIGQPLTLRVASTVNAPGGDTIYESFYDEISLMAVPEPSVTALLGLGLLAGG